MLRLIKIPLPERRKTKAALKTSESNRSVIVNYVVHQSLTDRLLTGRLLVYRRPSICSAEQRDLLRHLPPAMARRVKRGDRELRKISSLVIVRLFGRVKALRGFASLSQPTIDLTRNAPHVVLIAQCSRQSRRFGYLLALDIPSQ